MTEQKCGLCGESDFDKLVGPYAGGPYRYYCKSCREIIDEYHDTGIYNASCFSNRRNMLLRKFVDAVKQHEKMMKSIIQQVKVSDGMTLIFEATNCESST